MNSISQTSPVMEPIETPYIERDICCRWAPSLGALEDTHQNVWGTKEYDPETDILKPCVFFGLYGFPDFWSLWRHKGKRWILWAGSDIQHFLAGYFLDPVGKIRIHPTQLSPWIDTYCESYVENEVEQQALRSVGIRSKVVPSFLGDVTQFSVKYEPKERPKLYTSVSGDNFDLYGWTKIHKLAVENPEIEFHLYGNNAPWETSLSNVIVHGRVSKKQMNEEISEMQGAIRLTSFDGFSEILCKSILMGQWPVSVIEYPHMLSLSVIGLIHNCSVPNLRGREHYLRIVNNYPWNIKKHV